MIWLDITEENGNGIYLDIRSIEARRRQGETIFAISGVLGDGQTESEVLVEVGEKVEIVFVDEWLGKGRRRDLFERVKREDLLKALTESTSGMLFCLESFSNLEGKARQQVNRYRSDSRSLAVRSAAYVQQMELPLSVASPLEGWMAVA